MFSANFFPCFAFLVRFFFFHSKRDVILKHFPYSVKTAEITHVSFQQATGSKIKSEQSIPANALEEEHHARVGFQDSKQVVESYKSGFEPPGDVEFEDYGQAMKRALSECSLGNSRGEARERPAGKGKAKLWPFLKSKNKVRRPRGGFSVDSLTPLDLPPPSTSPTDAERPSRCHAH